MSDDRWPDQPLQAPSGISGSILGDDASSGIVGEYFSATFGNTSAGTSGQFANMATLSLTAGDWDISSIAQFNVNSAVITSGTADINLSQFSGNTTTDLVIGDNYASINLNAANPGNYNICIPAWRLSLASSATVYFKTRIGYSSGTPKWSGRVSARRMR